jgi:L-seryl-tRNA(Ser) seleniumtransferase
VGRADLVEACTSHPLARAVRADKVALGSLQQLALVYLAGEGGRIPFWAMATTPLPDLRARAAAIAARIPPLVVVETEAVAGAGSVPGRGIPSVGVALDVDDADAALARLRARGVVARIDRGAVVCDLRGVFPDDDAQLEGALGALCAAPDHAAS